MESIIVPFGKYKGHPIERMLADRPYREWAAAQPGIKQRFPTIYQIIVASSEPQETPEHNQLQARFLDDDFCARVWMAVNPYDQASGNQICDVRVDKREMEIGRREGCPPCDVVLRLTCWYDHYDPRTGRWVFKESSRTDPIGVEVKPTIGDDYPVVLRQMRQNQSSILVVGEYVGSLAQIVFEQIFREAGIAVVMVSDVDAPRTDQEH